MAKLELSYEMNRSLGKNRNTVLSLWYKIEYFQNRYGYCDKSSKELSKILKVSESTIKRCVDKLEELGLLLREIKNKNSRKLFAIRPTTESTSEPTSEPASEPAPNYIYKEIKNKVKEVVSIKEKEIALNEIDIKILKNEFEEEIVSQSIHIFNMNKKEQKIYNSLKYTRGICLKLIRNKKSLERKETKKRKQLELFEELFKNRLKSSTVDPSYYYDWMNDLE